MELCVTSPLLICTYTNPTNYVYDSVYVNIKCIQRERERERRTNGVQCTPPLTRGMAMATTLSYQRDGDGHQHLSRDGDGHHLHSLKRRRWPLSYRTKNMEMAITFSLSLYIYICIYVWIHGDWANDDIGLKFDLISRISRK